MMKRLLGAAVCAWLLLPVASAHAQKPLVVLLERPHHVGFGDALGPRMDDRGLDLVQRVIRGDSEQMHRRRARSVLRQLDGAVCVWLEEHEGAVAEVRAVDFAGRDRTAPLPSRYSSVPPRVFAVLAASLVDELIDNPPPRGAQLPRRRSSSAGPGPEPAAAQGRDGPAWQMSLVPSVQGVLGGRVRTVVAGGHVGLASVWGRSLRVEVYGRADAPRHGPWLVLGRSGLLVERAPPRGFAYGARVAVAVLGAQRETPQGGRKRERTLGWSGGVHAGWNWQAGAAPLGFGLRGVVGVLQLGDRAFFTPSVALRVAFPGAPERAGSIDDRAHGG
jgi:hypothetical protein